MTPFHVGMKVVCVDDGPWPDDDKACPKFITKNEIYTISSIEPDWDNSNNLIFQIIEAPKHWPWPYGFRGGEVWFQATRFRPIVKTDISLLEEIARKVTQGKRVDA